MGAQEFAGTARFRVTRWLGAGAMGSVYAAFDQQTQSELALKTLRHSRHLRLFKREFRSLADLAHPNLVQLYELIREQELWFFTMELLQGRDLLTYLSGEHLRPLGSESLPTELGRTVVSQPGSALPSGEEETLLRSGKFEPLSAVEASTVLVHEAAPAPRDISHLSPTLLRETFAQLAAGLTYLHAAGKLHRDLKPSNVLCTESGRAVILDFGLVADVSQRERRASELLIGTPAYMAPEQAACRAVGPAADWYAFGVMLFEVLTGRLPFMGSPVQVLLQKQSQRPPAAELLCQGAPVELVQLCDALLSPDPNQRPGSREILATLLGGTGASTHAVSHRAQTQPQLVGRQAELDTLSEALRRSRADQLQVLLVEGESGLGKSTLVRSFCRHIAGKSDVLVLSGRCQLNESLPYKMFDGVIDDLVAELEWWPRGEVEQLLEKQGPLLVQLFPVFSEVVKISPSVADATADPQQQRQAAFAALRQVVLRICAKRTLVLCIDDLQWGDRDSLALLDYLVGSLAAAPLLLLATARPDASLPTSLRTGPVVQTIRLSPLLPLDVQAFLRQLPAAQLLSEDALATVVTESGGHPLLLQELVRSSARPGGSDLHGLTLQQVLQQRIADLPAPARRIVDLCATSAGPLPTAALLRALDLPIADSQAWLHTLRAEQILRMEGVAATQAVDTYHDRIRQSALSLLPSEQGRQHHRQLAQALVDLEIDVREPQRVALHLEQAGETARAVPYYLRAAEQARSVLAFDRAADLLRRALALGRFQSAELASLRELLGSTLANAGRVREAGEMLLLAAEGLKGDASLSALGRAGSLLVCSGQPERGLALFGRITRDVGGYWPSSDGEVLGSILWHRLILARRKWRPAPVSVGNVSLEEYKRAAIVQRMSCIGLVDFLRGLEIDARTAVRALELGGELQVRAFAHAALVYGFQTASPAARAQASEFIERAESMLCDYPKRSLHLFVVGCRALVEMGGENIRTGIDLIDRVRSESSELGAEERIDPLLMMTLCGLQTTFAGAFFAWRDLQRLLPKFEDDARAFGNDWMLADVSYRLTLLDLVAGKPDRARVRMKQAPAMEDTNLSALYFAKITAQAELAIYEADLARFDEVRARLQRVPGLLQLGVHLNRVQWLHIRGRLALVEAQHTQGRRRLRALAEVGLRQAMLRRSRTRLGELLGLLLAAGLAQVVGFSQEAERCLHAAMEAAEAQRIGVLALLSRLRLAQLGSRRRAESSDGSVRAALDELGIQSPAPILDWIIPGFPRS